jgi:hypothetical protein
MVMMMVLLMMMVVMMVMMMMVMVMMVMKQSNIAERWSAVALEDKSACGGCCG